MPLFVLLLLLLLLLFGLVPPLGDGVADGDRLNGGANNDDGDCMPPAMGDPRLVAIRVYKLNNAARGSLIAGENTHRSRYRSRSSGDNDAISRSLSDDVGSSIANSYTTFTII